MSADSPVLHAVPSPLSPPDERPRFLSEADCHDIAQRLERYAKGGGYTIVSLVSAWRGNVRWARNQITTSGEVRDCHVIVSRNIRGAANSSVEINEITDEALVAAARRAERIGSLDPERSDFTLVTRHQPEPFTSPHLFFDSTYQLDAGRRAEAARQLAQSAENAGMLSAGYIEVSAHSTAYITSWGLTRYFQDTRAQYSVTVRDSKSTGSGWAGVDWPDWNRIDGPKLSAIALEKCLISRNPMAVEPGRYTTILEPQAVCDFIGQLMVNLPDRAIAEISESVPFHKEGNSEPPTYFPIGYSQIGERVMDERITISADPTDPDLSFPPFATQQQLYEGNGGIMFNNDKYHPTTWIEHGVLKHLSEDRQYGIQLLSRNSGLPNSGAFRMSGGDTSIAEMIATTKRGLLVTRFDQVEYLPPRVATVYHGYTRDGLWLIENGKISKPAKNLMFVESVLFALNNVEQLGPPQRAFHPPYGRDPWANPQPVIVPPLKIRDFSFTALSDAI